MTRINKSFKLESEPILHWPIGSARLVQLDGFRLDYSGDGLAYTLYPQKKGSVVMVQWEQEQGKVSWKNLFSEHENRPSGLLALAQLGNKITDQTVCEWVSRNGLLGFRHEPDIAKRPYHFVSYSVRDRMMYFYSEPLECIRLAAQRAVNVIELWSALKQSYKTGRGPNSVQEIRSIITLKEDLADSSQVGSAPINYRVFVNGERRSQRPSPKNPRDWRLLSSLLLAEYIQEHIQGEVRVALGVREKNLDREVDRVEELPPDWNLSPVWRIESALTAYYVELLMVMRRFRSCRLCGSDISHQKETSLYCGETCRSKSWHRQKAARRRASKTPRP